MSIPAAGWYPDPAGPGSQRWWDGVQWGQQTRAVVAAPPPPPPPPPLGQPVQGAFAQQSPQPYAFHSQPGYTSFAPQAGQAVTGAASSRLLRTNRVGFIGAVFALVSLIFNLFGLVSVAGVVLCIIGLVTDERLRNMGAARGGRGWMIAGLILGSLSTIGYWANAAELLSRLTPSL